MLGLALALPACGGSGPNAPTSRLVRGSGYSFEAPRDWRIVRGLRSIQARRGDGVVSVTVFPLARRYDTALWTRVVGELDMRLDELAAAEDGRVAGRKTITVADRNAREYEIDRRDAADERLVYVLEGRREYQLFCKLVDGEAGAACDRLVDSFRLEA